MIFIIIPNKGLMRDKDKSAYKESSR